jgi:hypothetical protein
MSELTLESLARRVEILEHSFAAKGASSSDWRRVVGMFSDSEFMRQVDEEGRKLREAERAAVRQEPAVE